MQVDQNVLSQSQRKIKVYTPLLSSKYSQLYPLALLVLNFLFIAVLDQLDIYTENCRHTHEDFSPLS